MIKVVRKVAAIAMACLTLASTTTAFAADYVNSVGSVAEDVQIVDNPEYTVTGQDTTQAKKSTYATVTATTELQESNVDIYATIAEGSPVYDPENPAAEEDGWVDGTVLVYIPTTVILSGTADEEGFYVGEAKGKVKGNIAGTTIINVTPENSVTLSSVGKDDITATVEQDNTKFTVATSTAADEAGLSKTVTPEFNDNAVFNVTIKTDEATAGSWHGTYTYDISLSSVA